MSQAPDPFYIMTTPVFKAKVVHQINQCMQDPMLTKDLGDFKESKATVNHVNFTDILGKSDGDYWWRLYINPMDWDKALAFAKDNEHDPEKSHPGLLYNYDKVEETKPKDFHGPMVKAYQKYLIGGSLNQHFGSSAAPIMWQQYLQLWEDARPPNPGAVKDGHFRVKTGLDGSFDGSQELAQDLYHEKFMIHEAESEIHPERKREYSLVLNLKDNQSTPKDGYPAFVCHFENWSKLFPQTFGPVLEQGINLVFKTFHDDMHKAVHRREQLTAIARAIRSLHVMHAFSDGCGRTNVFLLLPIMLLNYGFGLPLGGQHGAAIEKDAIHMMFNGGYSLDEMTQFLWVSQDFGLINQKEHKRTSIGVAATHVKPHAPADNSKSPVSPHSPVKGTKSTASTHSPATGSKSSTTPHSAVNADLKGNNSSATPHSAVKAAVKGSKPSPAKPQSAPKMPMAAAEPMAVSKPVVERPTSLSHQNNASTQVLH
ncbi:hypothetical protein MMC13_008473 [Lambiella insularis]|nr:hypothetical protein [Lambiella insularis]